MFLNEKEREVIEKTLLSMRLLEEIMDSFPNEEHFGTIAYILAETNKFLTEICLEFGQKHFKEKQEMKR